MKRIICFLAVFLLTVSGFCACFSAPDTADSGTTDPSASSSSAAEVTQFIPYDMEHTAVRFSGFTKKQAVAIHSVEELNALFSEFEGNPDLISHIKKYDDRFFANNSLFVAMFVTTGSSSTHEVTKLTHNGQNSVQIEITEKIPNFVSSVNTYWTMLIEIPEVFPAETQWDFTYAKVYPTDSKQ